MRLMLNLLSIKRARGLSHCQPTTHKIFLMSDEIPSVKQAGRQAAADEQRALALFLSDKL